MKFEYKSLKRLKRKKKKERGLKREGAKNKRRMHNKVRNQIGTNKKKTPGQRSICERVEKRREARRGG